MKLGPPGGIIGFVLALGRSSGRKVCRPELTLVGGFRVALFARLGVVFALNCGLGPDIPFDGRGLTLLNGFRCERASRLTRSAVAGLF